MARKRVQIYYSGRVQGVGFRFTAKRIAARCFDISGSVKNMVDGRVEIIAEGEEKNIKSFLSEIETEMGHYIRNNDVYWEQATGEFNNFTIQF